MSTGACRLDQYQHTASASLPDSLKRLEWWGWNICAEKDAMTYGNTYLLTVGLPKWENGIASDTIRFRIELEDLENGDKGEAIYDYIFPSYK